MGYKCCLGGFIEPSKSLGGKYEPNEKFRGQKQTLFYKKTLRCVQIHANQRQLIWNRGSSKLQNYYLLPIVRVLFSLTRLCSLRIEMLK
jgi:hypothetical protein